MMRLSLRHVSRLYATSSETIAGVISGTNVKWSEAVSIRVEYRLGRLWMLFEPTVWFGKTESDEERYMWVNLFVSVRPEGTTAWRMPF